MKINPQVCCLRHIIRRLNFTDNFLKRYAKVRGDDRGSLHKYLRAKKNWQIQYETCRKMPTAPKPIIAHWVQKPTMTKLPPREMSQTKYHIELSKESAAARTSRYLAVEDFAWGPPLVTEFNRVWCLIWPSRSTNSCRSLSWSSLADSERHKNTKQ